MSLPGGASLSAIANADARSGPEWRRHVRWMVARVVAGTALILIAYGAMPTDTSRWMWAAIPLTVIGLAVYTVLFVRQLRRVRAAQYPGLRAVEALVFSVLAFIVLFAAVAVELEAQSPGAYTESLNKIDGIYFSVTTLATVGYGDITPVTSTARVIGTIQMIGNLVLLGLAVRLLGKAMQRDDNVADPTDDPVVAGSTPDSPGENT